MDFLGSGVSEHVNELLAGGSPDDGIVHHGYPLSLEHPADRIELYAGVQIPYGLLRLDEGPSNVVVADQTHLVP